MTEMAIAAPPAPAANVSFFDLDIMAQQTGEFSAINEIIDLHYQLHRLSCILDQVIARSGIAVQPGDLAAADAAAISFVQKKFPALSIQKR